MELEYHNFSHDTLSELYFRMDLNPYRPDGYCRIDSILYYVTPLTKSEVECGVSIALLCQTTYLFAAQPKKGIGQGQHFCSRADVIINARNGLRDIFAMCEVERVTSTMKALKKD